MKKKRKQKRHNRAHAAANDCINERLAEAALAFHNGERFCWPGQNHLQRFDKRGEKSFLLPVIPWQTGASTRRCDGRNRPRTRGLRLSRNRGARRWNILHKFGNLCQRLPRWHAVTPAEISAKKTSTPKSSPNIFFRKRAETRAAAIDVKCCHALAF